jgi:hypothetical protein
MMFFLIEKFFWPLNSGLIPPSRGLSGSIGWIVDAWLSCCWLSTASVIDYAFSIWAPSLRPFFSAWRFGERGVLGDC